MLRVIIPDSHGCFIDRAAKDIFLDDLRRIDPEEIVMLGDHVDVSGIFKTHPDNYAEDLEYSYEKDIAAAEGFVDDVQKRAPRATIYYLEGNHEQHLERWAARQFKAKSDAERLCGLYAPAARLQLKKRGIKYFRTAEFHHGLSIRGSIRLGKCYFTHGISAAKYATSIHVARFGSCIVHGHTHRAQAHVTRTVAADEIGGWCPGTLAQLQPLYRHSEVSDWSHGYALQVVEKNGRFLHLQVPIVRGKSLLKPLFEQLDRNVKKPVFGKAA